MSFDLKLLQVEVLMKREDIKQAFDITTELLAKHRNNSKLMLFRSICLYKQCNFPMASKHLMELLKNDPDHSAAAKLLRKVRQIERLKDEGNTQFKGNQLDEAIGSYSRAIELADDNKAYQALVLCELLPKISLAVCSHNTYRRQSCHSASETKQS